MVTQKRKRSKLLTFVLFPLLMCIFIMGFFLSVVGEEKRTNEIRREQPKKDYTSIMPIVYEEQKEEIII